MSVDSFHTSGHSPGPDFRRPTAVVPPASRCRVGLLGFGTVGSAVARRLASHAVRGLDLTQIFDRRAHQKRDQLSPRDPGSIAWTDRVDDILTSNVDVVFEAIGGLETARNLLVTTSNAEFDEHVEHVSLCGLGVGRRLEAEAV